MNNLLPIVAGFVLFLILFSLQYTLNKVLVELKKIEKNTRGGRINIDEDYR